MTYEEKGPMIHLPGGKKKGRSVQTMAILHGRRSNPEKVLPPSKTKGEHREMAGKDSQAKKKASAAPSCLTMP